MWDDAKQQRLNELQQHAMREPLSIDDQQALEELLDELDQAEWETLRPVLSQLRRDQDVLAMDLGHLQAQHTVVTALADRYAALLARAKVQLAELTSEREALRREYERAVH